MRDPIDRFVSSFYWRLRVVCNYNDKRKRNKGAAHDPRRFCNRPLVGERRALEYYDKNASRIALSLKGNHHLKKMIMSLALLIPKLPTRLVLASAKAEVVKALNQRLALDRILFKVRLARAIAQKDLKPMGT